MIETAYTVGDATDPIGTGIKIIAHVCNDVGGWGSGFVVSLSKKWQGPETAYRRYAEQQRKQDKPLALGQIQIIKVEEGLYVCNMIAQHGFMPTELRPIKYDKLELCLNLLAREAKLMVATVHMPRIGCERGGGRWEDVKPIVYATMSLANVPVVVYTLPEQVDNFPKETNVVYRDSYQKVQGDSQPVHKSRMRS